jgi:hydrogenase maturation protein HypF
MNVRAPPQASVPASVANTRARASTPDTSLRRMRVRVQGTVQGVGFRPYVHRLATQLGLAGYVLNDAHGVLLEIEGDRSAVEDFLAQLEPQAPPLACIEWIGVQGCAPTGERQFTIARSPTGGTTETSVTPDSATCEDCLRELFDPRDRRYRYPFINCTNCGPRFTIVRGVPYDRPRTTMAGFAMCSRCKAEYEDPANRRFHAQPNACPRCGPAARLLNSDGSPVARVGPELDPIRAAAAALRQGAIVAVKGIGGYHLACSASDEDAVARLRARKHREDKPFALMAQSIDAACELVRMSKLERELLCSAQRPIVLAPRRTAAPVAPSVAPRSPELGVMLPYSPLHHLLLTDLGPQAVLVMTSGNVSDEPIAFRDGDAIARLRFIADLLLTHDRPIQTRTDDSIVRVVDTPARERALTLRRSRGYVPASIPLPIPCSRPLLACGAELKSTFCLAQGRRAWVSHHIGDLENYETLRSFTEGIEHFKRLFAIEPQIVAYDMHPEYLSSKHAIDSQVGKLVAVQHHHAHLAACLAEHGLQSRALGAIFDGTGYGPDGTIWGGELLLGDLRDFSRVGSLLAVRMPGGKRAIEQPWRMACAWLLAANGDDADTPAIPATLRRSVDPRAWKQIATLTRTGLSCPVTTSIGRLFDAVAALCGVRARVNYEGQAAAELEGMCDPSPDREYPIVVHDTDRAVTIDPRETIAAIAADVERGERPGAIAARFHATISRATVHALLAAASRHEVETVVLSGGVFQNRRLLTSAMRDLHHAGLRVLVPQRLPVGDGGISYGQAAVAASRSASGNLA